MPGPFVDIQGIVSRGKPAAAIEGSEQVARFGRYREEYNLSLIPKNHLLADEGSYFVTTNPTPGTGISTVATADASHSLWTPGAGVDLSPFFVCYNSAAPGTGPGQGIRVYLDSLQLLVTAAGTNGTAINFGVQIDNWASRQTAGAAVGGTSCVPINPNMDDQSQSVLKVWAGANVIKGSGGAAGAGGTVRMLPKRQLRPVIPVVGDIYAITFGGAEQFVGSLAPAGTAIAQQSFNYPPIIIGPGQAALLFLELPSQTVASAYEFDLCHWER